jgi:leader peptidase (prepilin peptidase) / N-methyltransferase
MMSRAIAITAVAVAAACGDPERNWLAMPAALIAAAAAAGGGAGWAQRAVVVRLAVPASPHPGPGSRAIGQAVPRLGQVPSRPGRWCSPPPLTVELTTAVLLAALAWRVRPSAVLAAAAWLAVCGVAMAFIDIAVWRLPDVLTGTAYAGVTGFLTLAAFTGGAGRDLARAAAGGTVLTAGFLILAIARPADFGLGDCKAAAATGTLLAWFSWTALIGGTLAALILAGLYGGGLLVTRRATFKARIAFGPFLIAGALLAVLLAAPS